MRTIHISLAFFCTLALIGCAAHVGQLERLELGMDKAQVREELGRPTVARGAIINKFEQNIEVWEYDLSQRNSSAWDLSGGDRRRFWIYFCNGKLVQWGQAGDWQREADRIYEYRFR